jgi:S-(hydroxymethyl)glutathione dehydrogenase / alcohol dehydrogenase
MRAAILREVGAPFSVETVELAGPGPHEVRVSMLASGFCHSDYSFATGVIPAPTPSILGHEGAGVVTEVGPSVTLVKPGEHVVLAWQSPCWQCRQCLAGQPELCSRSENHTLAPHASVSGEPVTSILGLGTFGEEVVTHERCVVPYPDHHPAEIAALVGCAVTTGVGAVINTARLRPGESAAVIGCGGVGLSAIQGARLAGASRIVAVDRVPEKLELALANGATDALSPEAAAEGVSELAGGVGLDHAFDCVGISPTMRTALDLVRPGGKVTVVGIGPMDQPVPFVVGDLVSSKTIRLSIYGGANPRRDFPRLLELDGLGRLDLGALVGTRIGLDRINHAAADMREGRAARTVIVY